MYISKHLATAGLKSIISPKMTLHMFRSIIIVYFVESELRQINPLWHSDAAWRQRSWSTSVPDGLWPIRSHAITYTNANLLLIGPLSTYFHELWIKMLSEMSSAKYPEISSSLDVFMQSGYQLNVVKKSGSTLNLKIYNPRAIRMPLFQYPCWKWYQSLNVEAKCCAQQVRL